MRVWFMVGAMVLGIIGVWGQQGRGSRTIHRGGDGTVSAQDGGSTVPSPKAP
jgi:hypothetical protein